MSNTATAAQDRRPIRRNPRTDSDRRRYDIEKAMQRALTGQSMTNYPAIVAGFTARGIHADEIRPRENVFTYQLWRQLGRQVRKGEHGVKITSVVPITRKPAEATGGDSREVIVGRRTVTATVFHISQTDLIASPGTDPANDPHRAHLTSLAEVFPAQASPSTVPFQPAPSPIPAAEHLTIPDPLPPRRPAWLDRFKARRSLAAA
jgi:hypothetical protein